MSRVQAGTVNASSGVTTQTTTLTGVVATHLLELSVHWAMNAASGEPSLDSTAVTAGWLKAGVAGPQVSAGNSGWITGVSKFYLQSAASGSNACKINFPASARVNSQMVEYSGYAASGALDKTAPAITASATTLTATTATTAQANELVTASIAARFVAGNANISLTDPPTGFTSNAVLQDTNTYAAFESSYKEVTSTGAQAATWSWAGAGEATALVVTYGTSAGTPATLSSPTPSGTLGTDTTAAPGATTNQGSGNAYVVVTTASLTGVTAAQVKAGQNASGSTTGVTSGNVAVSAAGAFSIALTGLTQLTTYNYAVVQNNANGDTNVVTGSFTTSATPPTVTTPVAGAAVAYLGSLSLTGTNFGASQGVGGIAIGGVSQTETAWSNTGATIGSIARGSLPYGAQNLVVTNNGAGASTPVSITLTPQAGWAYVTLGTINSTSAYRITAIADLAPGDILAYDTKGGLVTVNTDGTFVADPSVTSFDVEVWSTGVGWGSTGTQNLSGSSAALTGSALGSASASGSLTTLIQLAAVVSASASATAALTTGVLFAAAAAGSAGASGTLSTAIRLVGSASGQATSSAALTTAIQLSASANAVASALGILDSGALLQGFAGGQASAIGSLTVGVFLTGSAAASASASAALSTSITMAGGASAQASAVADFTTSIQLSGSASAVASALGALGTGALMQGLSSGQASAIGALTTGVQLAGFAGAAAAADGSLSTSIRLTGIAQAVAIATGSLNGDMVGAAIASASASADMTFAPRPIVAVDFHAFILKA